MLMAQRDLLELTVGLARAQTEHALSWAMLEQKIGRPIQRRGEAQGVTK
jgi:hypothetical protein